MRVSAVVPWRGGCPHRERAWLWVRPRLEELGFEVVEGRCPDGPFNRAWAILDGAQRASHDLLLVTDADVWGPFDEALAAVDGGNVGWAIPHGNVRRLNEAGTEKWYAGEPWGPAGVEEVHRGNETGTCVVVARSALEAAPPDPRFVGWGQEDDAWQRALRVMVGSPWRGSAVLTHLWHPAQPRKSRHIGSDEGLRLRRRYEAAQRSRRLMGDLLAETDELRRSVYPRRP